MMIGTEAARSHLILPEDVGLVVAGLWLTGLIRHVGELGLGTALIQRKDLTPAQVTAASDLILLVSLFWTLAAAALAPVVSWWNDNDGIAPIVVALAPMFLIQGAVIASQAELVRSLRFKAITVANAAGAAVQLVLITGLALSGWRAWSIVVGVLAGQLVTAVIMKGAAGLKSARPADWSQVRGLLWFGSNAAVANFFTYLWTNADYLLLGRWWPEATLAVYYNSYRLATMPAERATSVFTRVAFPALVNLPEDKQGPHLVHTTRLITTVAAPLCLGLVAVAPDAVWALFGPNWIDGILPVRVLAVVAFGRALAIIAPPVFLARGHVGQNLKFSMLMCVCVIAAVLIGVRWGPMGVAVAWAVVGLPLNFAVLAYAGRTVGVGMGALCRAIAPGLLRASVMAGAVYFIGRLLPESQGVFDAWWRLGVQAIAGAALYGTWTWFADPVGRPLFRAS